MSYLNHSSQSLLIDSSSRCGAEEAFFAANRIVIVYPRLDCTPGVRQIGLEQSARVFGFERKVLQIPPAVCIQERNADVCGYKLLG